MVLVVLVQERDGRRVGAAADRELPELLPGGRVQHEEDPSGAAHDDVARRREDARAPRRGGRARGVVSPTCERPGRGVERPD